MLVFQATTILFVSVQLLAKGPERTKASFIGNSMPFVWVRSLPAASVSKQAAAAAEHRRSQVGGWLGQLLGVENQNPSTSSSGPSNTTEPSRQATHPADTTTQATSTRHRTPAGSNTNKALANANTHLAIDMTHLPRLEQMENIIKRKKAKAVRIFSRGVKKLKSAIHLIPASTPFWKTTTSAKVDELAAGTGYSMNEEETNIVSQKKLRPTTFKPTTTPEHHVASPRSTIKPNSQATNVELLPPTDRNSFIYDLAKMKKSSQDSLKKHTILKRHPAFGAQNKYALVDVGASQDDDVAEKGSSSESGKTQFVVDMNTTAMKIQSSEEANRLIKELERLRDLVILRKIVQYMIKEKKKIVSNTLGVTKTWGDAGNEDKQDDTVNEHQTFVVYHTHTEAPDNTERNKRALQEDVANSMSTTIKPRHVPVTTNSATKPSVPLKNKPSSTAFIPSPAQAGPAYESDGKTDADLVEMNLMPPIMPSYKLASELRVATEERELGENDRKWRQQERLSKIYKNLMELTKHVVKGKPAAWNKRLTKLPKGASGGEPGGEFTTQDMTSMLDLARQGNAMKALKELKNLKRFDERILPTA